MGAPGPSRLFLFQPLPIHLQQYFASLESSPLRSKDEDGVVLQWSHGDGVIYDGFMDIESLSNLESSLLSRKDADGVMETEPFAMDS